MDEAEQGRPPTGDDSGPEGRAGDGARRAARPGGGSSAPGRRGAGLLSAAWEWTKTFLVAIFVFLFLRTFLVEAFQIPTASMENTLLVGDFLLVNKVVYGAELPGTPVRLPPLEQPGLGDVVVFEPPSSASRPTGAHYVKRIVGVPGDTLSMRDGTLLRNGVRIEEPYAKHSRPYEDPFSRRFLWQRSHLLRRGEHRPYRPTRDNWGPIEVPADSFFVLGDNRDNSEDSRYWGFVPGRAIVGKPLLVYYSYDRRGLDPFPWLTGIRWNRLLVPVD